MSVSGICRRGKMIGAASLSSFVFGILLLLGMLSILFYLRYSQIQARHGQIESLILPIYYLIVLFAILIGILIGLDSTIGFYYDNVYIRALKWICYQTLSESIAVLFLHNGVGLRAFRNAFTAGFSWALLSGIVPIIVYRSYGFRAYATSVVIFLALLLVFYLVCWLTPLKLMHRRPALIHLSRFYIFILCIFIIGYSFALTIRISGNCVVELTFALADFFMPFVVLRALRQDSKFWQGLYENSAASNLNQPLLGIWEMHNQTVAMVADSICTLERKVVNIISFGNLSLDTSKFFSGGSARVYKGRYNDNKVAVKLLFCIELTPQRVLDFCNEAALLHSLQHPNVVTCYGVSVMPPALCLVTEFCDVGSLYEFLHAIEQEISDQKRRLTRSNSEHFKLFSNLSNSGSHSVDFRDSLTTNPLMQAVKRSESGNSFPVQNSSIGAHGDSPQANAATSSQVERKLSYTSRLSLNNRSSLSFTGGSNDDVESGASVDSAGPRVPPRQGKPQHIDPSSSNSVHLTASSATNSVTNRSSLTASAVERSGSFIREFLGVSPSDSIRRPTSGLPSTSVIANQEMRPATSVLTSRSMGFGLGPADAISAHSITHSGSFRDSIADGDSMRKSRASMNFNIEGIMATTSQRFRVPSAASASYSMPQQQLGGLMPLSLRVRLARDCCAGIAYLHSCGFIHCDVKSLNFLVTSDLTVKLADLGEARQINPAMISAYPASLPRNINWSSPEVLRGATNVGTSSDVWSLAFVVSEIMSGEVPFDTDEIRKLRMEEFLSQLDSGMRPSLPPCVADIPNLLEMIQSAWALNPDDRCSASNLLAVFESCKMPIADEIITHFQRSI